MAKRKSEADQEAQEKAALIRRVEDMALGAYGGYSEWRNDDEVWMNHAGSAEQFGNWVFALKQQFGFKQYLYESRNLGKFETIDKATEFLYSEGVRA